MRKACVVWFRRDLRLDDNPALSEAAQLGSPVVPVFIWSPEEEGDWAPGEASCYWLHQSLAQLKERLGGLGLRLILRSGPALKHLLQIAAEVGAGTVLWNRRYEPVAIRRDTEVKSALKARGYEVGSFAGSILREPMAIRNKQGRPFLVFTPFWKHYLALGDPDPPRPQPERVAAPRTWPESSALDELGLEPRIDWAQGIRDAWVFGESGAQRELERFLSEGLSGYAQRRDYPGQTGVSRLSPHLHFGEISPRRVWRSAREWASQSGRLQDGEAELAFRRQLAWRDFAVHLLFHYPHTSSEPLRDEFKRFPWTIDKERLRAWQKGMTGYPIVDAGMRQLWETGWMHNRVRMIAASFLVKHLLQDWREGARWFWDTLVDADLANNTMGWQWTAGCGADAAPYFRIFNPITQGLRFDPQGRYVRRWVPELSRLSDQRIHRPWTASPVELASAGVVLGRDYPHPLVEHSEARQGALDAFQEMKSGRA